MGTIVGNKSARRRILVVDDDVDSVEIAAEILDAGGYSVRVAFDADSALQLALTFIPEIGLLDIGLPGKDGFDLLAALRAEASLAACRFIALTGYAGEVVAQRAHDAGFARLLLKPVSCAALLAGVEDGRALEPHFGKRRGFAHGAGMQGALRIGNESNAGRSRPNTVARSAARLLTRTDGRRPP